VPLKRHLRGSAARSRFVADGPVVRAIEISCHLRVPGWASDHVRTPRGDDVTITTATAEPIQLFTPAQLSAVLDVPVGTLANWRYLGRGPKFVRIGRHVRYRSEDLRSWLDGCAVNRRRGVLR
jgi:hypothetical protein